MSRAPFADPAGLVGHEADASTVGAAVAQSGFHDDEGEDGAEAVVAGGLVGGTTQAGLDFGPGLNPPNPWWHPKVNRAADQTCACGGKGFGWVGCDPSVVACYGCYRDAEKAGLAVAT